MTWLYSPSRRFRFSPQTREFQEFTSQDGGETTFWKILPPIPKHWNPPRFKKPVRRAVKFPDQMPDYIQVP